MLKVPYNTDNLVGKEAFINYTIESGDSLSVIAEKFKTDTKSIKLVNNLARIQVNVGQKILIPYNKKYGSTMDYEHDKSGKIAANTSNKNDTISLKRNKNNKYQQEIEDKYLSFLEKQEKLQAKDAKPEVNEVSKEQKEVTAPKLAQNSVYNQKSSGKYSNLENSIKNNLETGKMANKAEIKRSEKPAVRKSS